MMLMSDMETLHVQPFSYDLVFIDIFLGAHSLMQLVNIVILKVCKVCDACPGAVQLTSVNCSGQYQT